MRTSDERKIGERLGAERRKRRRRIRDTEE